jgi:hypothetical protein
MSEQQSLLRMHSCWQILLPTVQVNWQARVVVLQVAAWPGLALAMHSASVQHPEVGTQMPPPHDLYPVAQA